MRIFGILAIVAMVGIAASQSIFGGAPQGNAARAFALASADICSVEAMTLPVIREEERSVEIMPAHKLLEVMPAVFGTRTEELVLVPEHRAGATFFIEQKRVIVSEPTRRLRAVAPDFETIEAVAAAVMLPGVEGGKLVEKAREIITPPPVNIVLEPARIEAVRIGAGLKPYEIKTIDEDGDGALVEAETMTVEVRTVESHPSVQTTDVPAIIEEVTVEVVEKMAGPVEVDAVCAIAGHEDLVAGVHSVLVEKGLDRGAPVAWSADLIDAMAAAQAEETGRVSPYLLIETLRSWMPDVELPVS